MELVFRGAYDILSIMSNCMAVMIIAKAGRHDLSTWPV
jgi:hypothetical protein